MKIKKDQYEFIVFDFDGVLTDNKVYVFQDGVEAVRCNRADGLGCNMLKQMGMKLLILSTEENSVVTARAEKMNIPVLQGSSNKAVTLKNYCQQHNIELAKTCFVGNDINDLGVMEVSGFCMCPSDSHIDVIDFCDFVIPVKGGDGVVRFIADMLKKQVK